MFRALFCKELKNRRWYFVGGVVIFSAIALVIPSNYFGVFLLLQNIEFSTYVWGSWWGQGLWQLGFVYALLLGISSFEAEAREGVMEFLLTRNVTRCSVLAAKMLADMVILWLVAAVSTLALFMAAHYSGIGFTPPYSLTRATVFTGISFLVPYVIALLGLTQHERGYIDTFHQPQVKKEYGANSQDHQQYNTHASPKFLGIMPEIPFKSRKPKTHIQLQFYKPQHIHYSVSSKKIFSRDSLF